MTDSPSLNPKPEKTESTLSVKGFQVGAVDAGLYAAFGRPTRPDLTLVTSDRPCTAAGVFTTNLVKAAPVLFDMAQLAGSGADYRAVLLNTASANACTGPQGDQDAAQCAGWTASALGCGPESVLVLSTGVIGVRLPMPQMGAGIPSAAGAARPDGWEAASHAIMTTDTRPKLAGLRVPEAGFSVLGMAKGAGMIAPHMATMLAVIVTDADVPPALLDRALHEAVHTTFNRVVVDGDMSTNDTALLLANGASGVQIADPDSALYAQFRETLRQVCDTLARAIARDGEGATKFITVEVRGAPDDVAAHRIANTIATSPLVKTAFYGGDPNWGRILAAAGRAGVNFDPALSALWYETPDISLQLVAAGTPLAYDETVAKSIASGADIRVRLHVGTGPGQSEVYTCDLSHEYVSVNGHYRT